MGDKIFLVESARSWNFRVTRVPCEKWSCSSGTIFSRDNDVCVAIKVTLGIKCGSSEGTGHLPNHRSLIGGKLCEMEVISVMWDFFSGIVGGYSESFNF